MRFKTKYSCPDLVIVSGKTCAIKRIKVNFGLRFPHIGRVMETTYGISTLDGEYAEVSEHFIERKANRKEKEKWGNSIQGESVKINEQTGKVIENRKGEAK